jgi:ABC-type sugar transport system ATPase subunit
VPPQHAARVELARALVRTDLSVLLIDRLGAEGDPAERARLQAIVRSAAGERGLAVVQATADEREALALGDRVHALAAGVVVQVATPAALFAAPRITALAAALGDPPMNLLPCVLRGRWAVVGGARLPIAAAERVAPDAGDVLLGIRAEHVRLVDPDVDAALPAELLRVEDRGDRRLAWFGTGVCAVAVELSEGSEVVPGRRYGLSLPAAAVRLFAQGVLVDG